MRTLFLLCLALLSPALFARVWNVREHGAAGDGKHLDSPAINAVIEKAAAEGGGTVFLPAGTYLSYTLRLKSNITLQFETGTILLAARPFEDGGEYDEAEPNEWDMYQDFGHSHWNNSLIVGVGVENVAIIGPGLIDGTKGLTKRGPGPRRKTVVGDIPASLAGVKSPVGDDNQPGPNDGMKGQGNKAIGLKLSRNVILRDFSVLNGGHFALLATGVDNLVIDNLLVDTNRDAFDIDCCRNVRISNCLINSPNDDAICLKSSFGLGYARSTEDVTITNCHVSGFDLGTVLNGTYGTTQTVAPDREGNCGRIKFGTESNGGFKNITISNVTMRRCRGIAIETVDGAIIENVTITNISMRDIVNAPIFLRLGFRGRAPEGTVPGVIRGVTLSNIEVLNADAQYASIIAGIPDHPIENVTLSNIRIESRGGYGAEEAQREIPQNIKTYPEPSMFGTIPASGLYVRHARNIRVQDVEWRFLKPDGRPVFLIDDVEGFRVRGVSAPRGAEVPFLDSRNSSGVSLKDNAGMPDREVAPRESVIFRAAL